MTTAKEIHKFCHKQAIFGRGLTCLQLVYGIAGEFILLDSLQHVSSLVPRLSASHARIAYVTFEPLSDSWKKAWYHSYVIYKQSGHGYEAT